ncbi:small, acid-soluble spore protein K [Alkalicoccobacillus gibsonii]|uniref:Small, acid-soluble spore protein K n=1 Tax=Alkalicoccobacillus gibsonii TaxID=79881 RepID=A0ABU9VG44_9BACI
MRNKASHFPGRISLSGEPKAKPEFSSKRADGTIADRPQERMFRSNTNHSSK